MQNESSKLSKPVKFAIAVIICLSSIYVVVQFALLAFGYFAYDYRHPVTFFTDLIGLKPALPRFSEITLLDNPLVTFVAVMSVPGLYLAFSAFTVQIAEELYRRTTMSKIEYAAYLKKMEPKTTELGILISVTAGRAATTITTDQGFFFIHGIPNALQTGSVVRQIGNDIVFDHGKGNTKRYPLATKNEFIG